MKVPTRAALLTGRNHHTVGMGGITELATSAPGYSSMRPGTCATRAETLKLNGASAMESVDFMASKMEEFGSPTWYNHCAVGWAHALDTPYQWTKQVASHWGGTRNGTIVHWPRGIQARGEARSQFHHVIDVAPTVLEVAGLPELAFVHDIQQKPYEGVSMAHSFDNAGAAERRETQYFEMLVSRDLTSYLGRPALAFGKAQADRPGHSRRAGVYLQLGEDRLQVALDRVL